MLISFSLENFKSFKERAVLSLAARKADKTMPSALIGEERGFSDKFKLLPAVAVYGANASGKTNLLMGLAYMRRAVLVSQTSWSPETGTRFDPNAFNRDVDGSFEVDIFIDNVKYRYGFKVSQRLYAEEWLYSYPKGRERLLFKRATEEQKDGYHTELEVGPTFAGDRREHESSLRRTKENSLFLSSSAQDNQPECKKIENWFRKQFLTEIKLNVNELDQGLTSVLVYNHSTFKNLLLPLMRAADPCISDIIVRRSENEELDSISANGYSPDDAAKHKVSFVVESDGRRIEIPFDRQSRGVKRLYALSSSLISALKFGKVFVVDELETSMHPHVASQLLALFQNRSSNPKGAQLIFTTHETRLLNLQHLRRDQIWFCEREVNGMSSIYSLLEFAPRVDENFEVGYHRGRYGAVPMAGIDPSWLMAINDGDNSIAENQEADKAL